MDILHEPQAFYSTAGRGLLYERSFVNGTNVQQRPIRTSLGYNIAQLNYSSFVRAPSHGSAPDSISRTFTIG